MIRSLTPLLAFCLLSCGSAHNDRPLVTQSEAAIIGGSPVSNDDLIKTVSVKIYMDRADSKTYSCSGVLISHNALLTAAHCAANMISGNIYFYDGSNPTAINMPIIDPKYQPTAKTNRHDFAIVKFKKDKPIEKYARLASWWTEPKDGDVVAIAGFGQTYIGDPNAFESFVLKSLPVKILNINFSDSEIEINEGANSGACHGDSGGPGYSIAWGNVFVWGVDSRNSPRASQDCYGYELYSRIRSDKDWIERVISTP